MALSRDPTDDELYCRILTQTQHIHVLSSLFIQFQLEHHATAPTSHTMHGMLSCSGRNQFGPYKTDASWDTISLVIRWIPGLISQLISVPLKALLPPASPLIQSAHSLSTRAHSQPLMKWDKVHQLIAISPHNKMVRSINNFFGFTVCIFPTRSGHYNY